MKRFYVFILSSIVFLPTITTYSKELAGIQWEKIVINADSQFEAAGIGDIDLDGNIDIMCGSHWYAGPDFKTTYFITEIEKPNTYYNDFANELMDVDGDGDLDAISATWFSQSVLWRENPGEKGKPWTVHQIDKPGNCETALLVDINNDGNLDILPNMVQSVVWYEKLGADKAEWKKHDLGAVGAGHGQGAGDINGDGYLDILCRYGWYESRMDGNELTFTFRNEWNLGTASVPLLTYDVNQDGKQDLVWGMGHDYGLYWLEQSEENGKRMWWRYTIDESWSQAHYIFAADIADDKDLELIAGKRVFAHDGHDPGGNDTLVNYVYQFNQQEKTWDPHTIHEGGNVGFGLNPGIGDIDGDGDIDIVCPGKKGLYLFKQN
jgi:hypothetical protein